MGRLADSNRAAKAKFNGAGLIAKPNQKRAGPPRHSHQVGRSQLSPSWGRFFWNSRREMWGLLKPSEFRMVSRRYIENKFAKSAEADDRGGLTPRPC